MQKSHANSMGKLCSGYSLIIKTLKINEPKFLKDTITSTLYTTRRKPLIGKFYNNARGKIGKQALHNCLEMMDCVDFDWIGQDLSDDRIRAHLKKTYFWQRWRCLLKIVNFLLSFVSLIHSSCWGVCGANFTLEKLSMHLFYKAWMNKVLRKKEIFLWLVFL